VWAAYIKELYGKEMLETEYGFATYFIVPGTSVCYLEDIFVAPEHRKSRAGTELENAVIEWAKERKCTEIMGSAAVGLPTTERSVAVLIARGYKLSKVTETMLYFKKNI